ncbi:response regulator transcription factor [Myroides ceti]|uniref:Response regulator transcription factor n=1 Tax=Paenimyroides ceti TaxID=395087 RepID=A0ABT8CT47_9FLAO|nr:response regulator transcription factor [Paenimyroides ceti]MDN3707415.1 response regulator transcription factor [Paenimyroides ceti]
MIKAIAIDDEPLALKIIEHHCSKIESISLEKTFTNQTEAIKYINKFPVDLLFLDIQMPQNSGIDFYKNLNKDLLVIFTTAYDTYAVEGFNVNAIDYIMKPIGFSRFEKAVEKAVQQYKYKTNTSQQDHLLIRADYKLNKIDFKDILYIEGLDDYIQIYLVNKPKIVARMSMKSVMEKLPEKYFLRIHRSYIVSIPCISAIQNKQIELENKIFPIGETYKNEVFTKLKIN